MASASGSAPRKPLGLPGGRKPLDPTSGGKNWMFADAIHGVEANANLYRLVETAKANGIEPWAYLERVFDQIPRAETLEDLDALLPRRIRLRNDGVNCVVRFRFCQWGFGKQAQIIPEGNEGIS